MKSKNAKSILVVVAMVAILAIAHFVPIIAQPGDASDPLVTRRYVDDRVAQLTAEINNLRNIVNSIAPGSVSGATGGNFTNADRDALFADIMVYFETMYGDMLRTVAALAEATDPTPGTAQMVPFEPLFVPAGRTLIADGGTEIILRSGQAIAISGPDGLVDATAGVDIINGRAIPLNHLLLVPRTDGRGMRFTTDAWLLIKGGHQIVN